MFSIPPDDLKEMSENIHINDPRIESLVKQAAETLNNNQECYVAQWILHNQDKNFDDYMLVNEWRKDGFGYNFYMVKRDQVNA